MARADVLQPYFEKVLREVSGVDSLQVGSDGGYGFRSGSAGFRVKLVDADPPFVGIYSFLLNGVKKSHKLLDRLNEMNSGVAFGRFYWEDNSIVIATELIAESLDAGELQNACAMVGVLADHYDTQLQNQFGGQKLGEDESQNSVDV